MRQPEMYEDTVNLIEKALQYAHAQGVKGDQTPDRSDAERVTWQLVELASHSVARRMS